MNDYNIKYEILNFESFNARLNDLVNSDTLNKVVKHEPIGYSACGFPIEHYSIGTGPMHITYMGGAHGNEIISVDFVTQLMRNLADGKGRLENIDLSLFTIDFIPCQNPEGFYVTTYALKQKMDGMSEDEIEAFSKKYWQAYRNDDIQSNYLKEIIKYTAEKLEVPSDGLINVLWKNNIGKDIYPESIANLFGDKNALSFVKQMWTEKFGAVEKVNSLRQHHALFDGISLDCIPEIDEAHKKLKVKISKMYESGMFPIESLANFFANADGVNINDNNIEFYNEFKANIERDTIITGNNRDSSLIKSIPGPMGMPSKSMSEPFAYSPENSALINYIVSRDNNNYAFINCHGTGGVLYIYPVWNKELDTSIDNGVEVRNFSFYINNRLGTEYIKETGRTYLNEFGKNDQYRTMGHPSRVTGFGDYMRKNFKSSLLLELSKMGGNPIAPYGDKNGNYMATMVANFNACKILLLNIKEMEELYNMEYTIDYKKNGQVKYGSRFK